MTSMLLYSYLGLVALLTGSIAYVSGSLFVAALAALLLALTAGAALWLRAGLTALLADLEGFAASILSDRFDADLPPRPPLETSALRQRLAALNEDLKKRLGLHQTMLTNLIVPMIVIDVQGDIKWLNESMIRLTENEGTPDSFVGKPFSPFFYNENRESIVQIAVREREKKLAKADFLTRKGNRKYISIAAAPILDPDGKLVGGFASVADFTNVVLKEKTISEQNARIAQTAQEATVVAHEVAMAAGDMENRISSTSRGMEDQRGKIGELAAAVEQMNATILEVARAASEAADTAGQANDMTKQGAQVVDKVMAIMEDVNSKAEGLKSEMADLGGQAQGIGQIMQVISDIADQTNLLALNAAIEAARAGDAGRGFAVVADEVRKLAEKTMAATKEVAGFITAIQDSAKRNIASTEDTTHAISQAEDQAQAAGQALRRILDFVTRSSDQMRGIAAAAEQQSAASEEITRSTHGINDIAGDTTATMSEAASSVARLADMATELETAMARMQDEG